MIIRIWQHRALLAELVRQDFTQRYRGSYGGILWSFAQPVALLTVFTLAFGVLFSREALAPSGGGTAYALAVFPGLLLFQALAEVLNKSPALITGNPAYVRKIAFPLELLAVTTVLSALCHALIGLLVWAVVYGLFIHEIPSGILFLPMLLAIFTPVLLGVGLLFSAASVFFRDLGQLVGLLGQALLFLSPVFYRIEDIPRRWQRFLYLNPITLIVEQVRIVVTQGRIGDWAGLALYLVTTSLVCTVAWWIFHRCRGRFADWL